MLSLKSSTCAPRQSIAVSRAQSVPMVKCRAAPAATAWDSWSPYMSTRKSVADPDASEKKYATDISTAISKASASHKPRFVANNQEAHGATFKLQHMDKIAVPKELPSELHDKLEAIGVSALKNAISIEGKLDYANISYTTTNINAGLSVIGTVIPKGGDKSAVLVMVATETERQASWSRLEGLVLHWGCSESAGAPWVGPPEGWVAVPNKTKDAGGAWQCGFEKQTLPGTQEQVYVLVLQLPLSGVLRTGGLTFVLKATENQADKWLQDASTKKDFFLDLQKLPVLKA